MAVQHLRESLDHHHLTPYLLGPTAALLDKMHFITEIHTCPALQDDAFKELRGKRQGNRSKGDKYYANRRFGQGVRQKAAAGLVDEARDMCAKQVGPFPSKL